MAGRYGRKYMKDEDFEEGDVWSVMEGRENPSSSSKLRKPIKKELSFSPNSSIEASRNQFSAPVDIPDWSKIYGKSSKKKNNNITSSSSWVNNLDQFHGQNAYYANHDDHVDGGDGDDDDDDDGMVPPHEYLARKLARSQISSFSVYEGIGRTLKGRDLSKLRNAILTKTGFIE